MLQQKRREQYIYAIPMLNEKKVYDRLYSPAKNVNLIQAHTVLWMLYVPWIGTQEGEKKNICTSSICTCDS